jgi:hypothetical protein
MTNARSEAIARTGGRYDARVLEPSPPAVNEGPFFADDPTSGGDLAPVERPGSQSWDRLCRDAGDAELSAWCADRWLAAWRRLGPLPVSFADTAGALHGVAEHVVAPARHAVTGKIGLRFTRQGFGTPFFGNDRQVRMEGALLVIDEGVSSASHRLTTLLDAAQLAGVEPGQGTGVYQPSTPWDPSVALHVDPEAAAALADWYGFCTAVLEQLRQDASDASRVQLWPEHFDIAVDFGDDSAARRANFGGSPGDAGHEEPYLYVGPWQPQAGTFWNESFGASLSYRQLLAAEDQRGLALEFFAEAIHQLGG